MAAACLLAFCAAAAAPARAKDPGTSQKEAAAEAKNLDNIDKDLEKSAAVDRLKNEVEAKKLQGLIKAGQDGKDKADTLNKELQKGEAAAEKVLAGQGAAPAAEAGKNMPPAQVKQLEAAAAASAPRSVSSSGARAVEKARRMERMLRSGFSQPLESTAPGPDLSPARREAPVSEGTGPSTLKGSNRLGEPVTKSDLVMASFSGFGAAFEDAGLHTGPGPGGRTDILRLDGTPASTAELGALAALIRSEPLALTRRPDFYSVIPRPRFIQLKEDLRSRTDMRDTAFRHIALSVGERDFLRSASCARPDACNPYAARMSYTKGDFVPPEDLGRIWSAVNPEPEDGHDLGEFTAEESLQRELAALADDKLSRSAFGAGGARRALQSLGGMLASWFSPTAPPDRESETAAVQSGPGGSAPAAPAEATATAGPHPGAAPKGPPPPHERQGPRRASRAWLALACIGAALGAAALRLRRRGPDES